MFTTRYQDLDTLIARDKHHKTAAGRSKWVEKQVAAGAIRVLGYSETEVAPATPAAPAASYRIQDHIVETRHVTVANPSTRVIDDTQPHAWVVGCEGNHSCDHRVLVAKRDYRPVSFADIYGPAIETIYDAPGRRTCVLHRPRHA